MFVQKCGPSYKNGVFAQNNPSDDPYSEDAVYMKSNLLINIKLFVIEHKI